MSVEKVEELVLGKARQEAEALVAEARRQAQSRLQEAEAELRQRNGEESARYQRQLQEETDRELAARSTEHNRQLLTERNRLLQEVRQRAQHLIAERPQPHYRRWLARQLRQLSDLGQGELICRDDDRECIAELLQELASEGVRLDLTLPSEGLSAAAGGFVVCCPDYDVDVTLESQLRALWSEVVAEVAARLFGSAARGDG